MLGKAELFGKENNIKIKGPGDHRAQTSLKGKRDREIQKEVR